MTIRLPSDQDILFPLVRILVMPAGNWTATTQPWSALPVPSRMDRTGKRYYGKRHGYELDSVEEPPCLPLIGAAVFHFDYGPINGTDYDIDDGSEPTTARDLLGYDVRIQLAAPPTTTTPGTTYNPSWKTVFLGTVIAQEDAPWDDDQISSTLSGGGRRTYRCADLLWRTQQWPMNRHTAVMQTPAASSDVNPRAYLHSYGHPGYNYAIQGYYRRLMGNKWSGTWPLANGAKPNKYRDPFGDQTDSSDAQVPGTNIDKYLPHTWTGADAAYCTTWSDLEVANHALASSRSRGEPCFVVRPGDNGGSATQILAQSKFPWPVNEGESCWDFINRVLSRQRARGLARLWWTKNTDGTSLGSEPDAANQPGNLYPCIAIFPQNLADITFTPPGGAIVTYYGATSCGTSVAVDLAGDHRVPSNSIEFAKNATATIDYLESFGEPIEILVTLSPGDSASSHGDGSDGTLAKRWASADETAFASISGVNFWQRSLSRWRNVWQRWSLPPTWDFKVGDGNGSTRHNCNWYCDDSATLQLYDTGSAIWSYDTNGRGTPSPLTCRILSDLPLYEGYDYTTDNHTRYDAATDTLSPPRLPPMVLANSSGTFLDAVTVGAGLQNDDFGVLITSGPDIANGTRMFSSDSVPGNVYGAENLVVTVGLQLSHRVRVASANGSYTPINTPRRKSLYFPGVFLWLADSYAIWRIGHISGSDASPFMAPARAACGATPTSPGLLRDDRAALMSLHYLAWAWYSVEHRTARWEMRDCGLMTSFTSNDSDGNATTVNYPTVGQFVTTVTCSQIYTANTPITRKVYDAARGVTTWFTDWCDLDLA